MAWSLILRLIFSSPSPAFDATLLKPGEIIEAQLKGGDSAEYRLALHAGDYANILLVLRSVSVRASIFAPDGALRFETGNTTIGARDSAEWIADTGGEYRVVVGTANAAAPAGQYTISLHQAVPATEAHRRRAAASAKIAEAMRLWSSHKRESVQRAAVLMEEALVDWKNANAPVDQAQTAAWIASACAEIGDQAKALRYASEALVVAKSSQDRATEAWALNTAATVENSFGQKRKAIVYLTQALAIMRERNDPGGEAHMLNGLGMAHAGSEDLRKAAECFEGAAAIFTRLGNEGMVASVLGNLGVTYGHLGDYRRSLAEYSRALELSRSLGRRVGEAILQNNIGTAFSSLADYQRALDAHQAALEIHRSLGRKWNVAISLHNIASVYANLGESRRARSLYEEALAVLRRVKDPSGTSNTLNNLAETQASLGDTDRAIENHLEALLLRRTVGNRNGEALSLNNLAKLYAKSGQTEKAAEHFERALAILRETGDRRSLAGALRSSGIFRLRQKDADTAFNRLNESLAICRQIQDRQCEADSLGELARAEHGRSDLERAHQRASEALSILESLRRTVANPNLRATYFAASRELQELDIALLMQLQAYRSGNGYAEEALLGAERGKARSLLETLGEASREIRRGADPRLLERELELEQSLYAQAERQTRLLNAGNAGPASKEAAQQVDALARELEQVQGKIRETSPQYAALAQPSPLGLKQIQTQVLDAGTILLEFSLGSGKSFLWAVTRDSVNAFELPARPRIEALVRRVHECLTARNRNAEGETPRARASRIRLADESYTAAAAEIGQILLSPVAPLLGDKRLLIVADGALLSLPFASLPDPNRPAVPLIVNHEVVTAPSASVIAVIRQQTAGRARAPKALAVVADPVFSAMDSRVQAGSDAPLRGAADFLRLRFSRREAERISRFSPPEATWKALDFDASRETVLATPLSEYRILHFATHSQFDNEHPELSGVVLSCVDENGRPRNGFLRLNDIYNLRLNSDLVVLSACETALGAEIKGEGLIGLTRAFLYAGSPRVVATLWKIDDRATAGFMDHFYEAMLIRGERPAAALRSAQIAMWKETGSAVPYDWAAFSLQGEWR